jgi:hypothetical protein
MWMTVRMPSSSYFNIKGSFGKVVGMTLQNLQAAIISIMLASKWLFLTFSQGQSVVTT